MTDVTDNDWPNVKDGLDVLALAVLGVEDFYMFYMFGAANSWGPESIEVDWFFDSRGDVHWSGCDPDRLDEEDLTA